MIKRFDKRTGRYIEKIYGQERLAYAQSIGRLRPETELAGDDERPEPPLREVVLRRNLRVRDPLEQAVSLLPEEVEIARYRSVLHFRPGDFKDAVADSP